MAYAELWCQSAFSFHEGASMPEELVPRALELGLLALGLSDRGGVYGLVRGWKAAREHDLKLLHGVLLEVEEADALREVVLYAQDRAGWGNLCELVTRAQSKTKKGTARARLDDVGELSAGLLALVRPDGEALAEAFGDRLYVTCGRRLLPADAEESRRAEGLGRRIGRPVIAVNRALHHTRRRQPLQDLLTCVREKLVIDRAGTVLQANAERTLKGPAEMMALFSDRPRWVHTTREVVERCSFHLGELDYRYPPEVVPEGETPMSWLRRLTEDGVRWRWPGGPPPKVRAQIEHELSLIEELEFPAYFLTVYDIVRFARSIGILCQGRGSAANSAVCYALGITAVDPARASLLFERFISKERGEPPDIDVDFEHERREEVIQYIYARYGRDRAGMVNEVISYRPRSAVRAVGKAMGLSLDQVDRLAKGMDWWDNGVEAERVRACGLSPEDPRVQQTIALAGEVLGFPRHTSIHVGGFVITEGSLRERCPVEPAAMADRTVVQWDKDDIDAVRFIKVDVLALGMLTAIRKCFDLCRLWHGHDWDLATLPAEDPFVYDAICRADTIGVFQIESRAQMSMLPRLKPRTFYDLVIEVSIVRPGPIQGGMVHPYLDRRSGKEPVTYAHPDLEPILARTLGVPIFQEQVMAMAMAVGGFSAGEADELRRAMGAWRKRGGLEELTEKLVRRMVGRGLDRGYAEQVAQQIKGFGEYGFPESHAASFALLIYVSCYLHSYYPAAFAAALLNSQPMGFYAPRSILADAERHGVAVRDVDVTRSDWDNTLEADGEVAPSRGGQASVVARGVVLRMGFRQIQGIGEEDGLRIEEARAEGAFEDLADFAHRTRLDRGALRKLAKADAFRGLGLSRRDATWEVDALWTRSTPLLSGLAGDTVDAGLPQASLLEDLQQDYLALGLSLRAHPLGLCRDELEKRGAVRIASLSEMAAGGRVRIGGLVSCRQRPHTAAGVLFMTLEDETGMANLVVWPKLYERQRRLIRGEQLLYVDGKLQREGDAVSILATRFERLRISDTFRTKSRDFR